MAVTINGKTYETVGNKIWVDSSPGSPMFAVTVAGNAPAPSWKEVTREQALQLAQQHASIITANNAAGQGTVGVHGDPNAFLSGFNTELNRFQPETIVSAPDPANPGQTVSNITVSKYQEMLANPGMSAEDFKKAQPAPVTTPVTLTPTTPLPPPTTPAPQPVVNTFSTPAITGSYTVNSGDNLSQIAAGYGLTWQQLYEANKDIIGSNPNLIKPGQILKIPSQTGNITPVATIPPTGQPNASGGVTVQPTTIPPATTVSTTPTTSGNGVVQGQITDLQSQLAALQQYGLSDTNQLKKDESGNYVPKSNAAEDIYTKYGIDAKAQDWLNYPTKSFEDTYTALYEKLGLADTKKLIEQANADYETAVGKINENPWLSEAGRTGKISKLDDKYQRTITRLQSAYDKGKEEATNLATTALNQYNQQRTFAKEELDYYMKRAEADIAAQQQEADTAGKYRYENIKELNGGLYNMDTNTWVVAPKAGTSNTDSTTRTGNLTNVGLSASVTTSDGAIVRAKMNKLIDAGIPEETAQGIMDAISQGNTLEEIRQYFRTNGVDPKILDIFMTTLQG